MDLENCGLPNGVSFMNENVVEIENRGYCFNKIFGVEQGKENNVGNGCSDSQDIFGNEEDSRLKLLTNTCIIIHSILGDTVSSVSQN